MEPAPNPPAAPRRIWPWVLGGCLVCLTPFVVFGLVALSVLTLSRDALVLRRHVMAATNAHWATKVQFSVPNLVLSTMRTGSSLVRCDKTEFEDAKLALKAVRNVSVGVYELDHPAHATWSRAELFAETDKAMQKRGWVRMVGVIDHNDTVLIYMPKEFDDDEPVDVCLAVVSGREMVVCSTKIDFDHIAALAERHMGEDLKHRLKLGKLRKL